MVYRCVFYHVCTFKHKVKNEVFDDTEHVLQVDPNNVTFDHLAIDSRPLLTNYFTVKLSPCYIGTFKMKKKISMWP